jgi:hypothetical protein
VWIKRLGSEVQQKPLWDSGRTINKAGCCVSLESPLWENPARITTKNLIQVWLTFVNGLLSFKIPERIVAGLPHPLRIP